MQTGPIRSSALAQRLLHRLAQPQQRVGPRVLQAFERLMGLILVAVAVEMLLRAVRTLAAQLGGG